MDEANLQLFRDTTEKVFAFLISDYGFKGPTLDIDQPWLAFLTYKAKKVGIELYYEDRDKDIQCRILKLINDERPDTFCDFDNHLNPVRLNLFVIIEKRGFKGFKFQQVPKKADLGEEFRISLENYANLLKERGQDILFDSVEFLN